MKTGATDPFADDDESDDRNDEPVESASRTGEYDEPDNLASHTDESYQSDETENREQEASNTDQFDRSDLPRILARDKVKDDRDDVHQLFVYADTSEKEKRARRELEDRLGDDLYKLDVREAIYLAGMENLDDAERILREWGADI